MAKSQRWRELVREKRRKGMDGGESNQTIIERFIETRIKLKIR